MYTSWHCELKEPRHSDTPITMCTPRNQIMFSKFFTNYRNTGLRRDMVNCRAEDEREVHYIVKKNGNAQKR